MRRPDLLAKGWTRHFRETCGNAPSGDYPGCDRYGSDEYVVEVMDEERRICLACGRSWLAFYAAPGYPVGKVRLMPEWEKP